MRSSLGDLHLSYWLESLPAFQRQFVYVVQGDSGTPIKIGKADNVRKRLAQLQTGNPQTLRLLHALPGATVLERDLHLRIAEDRHRGEWFQGPLIPDFLSFVADLSTFLVEAHRTTGRIPHHREFGSWPRRYRRSGESPVAVSFVDPATLRA